MRHQAWPTQEIGGADFGLKAVETLRTPVMLLPEAIRTVPLHRGRVANRWNPKIYFTIGETP